MAFSFSTAAFTAVVGIYAIFLVLFIYVFFFADPHESKLAFFITETLPQKTWGLLHRLLPQNVLYGIQFVVDRFLMMFYLALFYGGWSIVWFFVFPMVEKQDYVGSYHKAIGVFFFAACMISWRYASSTSPGIITASNIHRYNHFPYDNVLFVPQTCKTTSIIRPARSKFDRHRYNGNVPRFDHFCGWVYNTIGEENYRFFLLFLLMHVVACGYGAAIIAALFYGHLLQRNLLQAVFVDRFTGQEVPATNYLLFQYLFDRFTLQCAVAILMGVMSVALGFFLGYHIWLTSRGMTTNESYKWDDVRKWYNFELSRYNEAVKQGLPVSDSRHPSKPQLREKDVTCTSASSVPDVETDDDKGDRKAPQSQNVVEHPGPEPNNIYNRGVIENWKEVIFPISLRSKTAVQSVQKPKSG
jgi:palmitoyltransferase